MIDEKKFTDYQKDFEYCESIIKEASQTFYYAFSKLPRERAWSVFAVYAFCRKADDFIDVYQNPDGLKQLERELDAFKQHKLLDDPIWRALSIVFSCFDMQYQPFYDMLSGQKMDIDFKQPQTQQQLSEYCYYVAGSVGLMILPILSDNWHSIISEAKKLGEAMQLTNILRDVGEDIEKQRIYFPEVMMEKYKVGRECFEQKRVTKEFIALWESQAQRAEKLFDQSMSMLPYIRKDCQEPLVAAAYYYREILEIVRKNNYPVFVEKSFVSHRQKWELQKKIKKRLNEG